MGFLPWLLVREQWRCLLSTRGASTWVTRPHKVNQVLDRNPGKKGSQWAEWTALMGKDTHPHCRNALSGIRQIWADIKRLVLEPAAGERPWRTSTSQLPPEPSSTLCTLELHPLLTNSNSECIFCSLCLLRSRMDPCPTGTKRAQSKRITEGDSPWALIKIRKCDTFLH